MKNAKRIMQPPFFLAIHADGTGCPSPISVLMSLSSFFVVSEPNQNAIFMGSYIYQTQDTVLMSPDFMCSWAGSQTKRQTVCGSNFLELRDICGCWLHLSSQAVLLGVQLCFAK